MNYFYSAFLQRLYSLHLLDVKELFVRCLTVQKSSGWILMSETTGVGLSHWRKRYYGLWIHILTRSNCLKLKHLNDGFVSYKYAVFFALQDINWWTGVVWITCGLLWCFYQLFGLSYWRHPFTAEDLLVSNWWNLWPKERFSESNN